MVDIEALLQPISPDNPVGQNLLGVPADDTFRRLDEMATEYDAATSPSGQAKESDWPGVVRLASSALQANSKDLNLVSGLTEGLVRTEGYSGLRDGLSLARRLLEQYWKKLHPGHGEDGTLHYAVHFKGLSVIGSSREFITAVQKIPIVPRPGKEPLGWFEYTMARRSPGGVDEASRLADQSRYDAYISQGFVTSSDWLAGLSASSGDELRKLLTDLQSCREELASLMTFFLDKTDEEKTPAEQDRVPSEATPNFLPLRDLLDDVVEVVEKAVPGEDEGAAEETGGEAGPQAGGGESRALNSRADALRQLDQVADFLHRTDPHSPVAFLVKRAVRWGNMPLEQVLAEILQDDGSLSRVRDALGLRGDTGEPQG
jgi:type VI secretion system protein ImpA